ncbi:MFS transporter [Thaumasiovibrio subtropicus]|uniref:MFS transporter n=1 Tax=Thaumasiovibrio subtropicus TaxID=1891207 RepID=UPI000B352F2F|nr:MFS transporter [Thaumasiovibrio subtropicus]
MQDASVLSAVEEAEGNDEQRPLPLSIYLLSVGIFIMISCELQVLGMMPQLSTAMNISISNVGYLVSVFAASMAIGGPMLALLLAKLPPKRALILLYLVFIFGELLGAVASSYGQLVIARVITGAVSGAFFGTAIGLCARLVEVSQRIKAVGVVLAGIMVGTIIGLPLAKLIAEWGDWRLSFYVVTGMAVLSALFTARRIPVLEPEPPLSLSAEIRAVFDKRLWWVFGTSFFVIGAVYAPFSYIVPILTDLSGLSAEATTGLLFAYGLVMLIGNYWVAKFAAQFAKALIAGGVAVLVCLLIVFALFASHTLTAVACTLLLGLCGVSLNPALVSRLMMLPQGERAFVNTLHSSVITLGIMLGSVAAGFALELGYTLVAPLWVGALIAIGALFCLQLCPPLANETS